MDEIDLEKLDLEKLTGPYKVDYNQPEELVLQVEKLLELSGIIDPQPDFEGYIENAVQEYNGDAFYRMRFLVEQVQAIALSMDELDTFKLACSYMAETAPAMNAVTANLFTRSECQVELQHIAGGFSVFGPGTNAVEEVTYLVKCWLRIISDPGYREQVESECKGRDSQEVTKDLENRLKSAGYH